MHLDINSTIDELEKERTKIDEALVALRILVGEPARSSGNGDAGLMYRPKRGYDKGIRATIVGYMNQTRRTQALMDIIKNIHSEHKEFNAKQIRDAMYQASKSGLIEKVRPGQYKQKEI